MPTYRQISRLYEDGYGEVVLLLTVSDTYAGLFATSGQIDAGVFDLDTSKRDLDIAASAMVEDELGMTVDESVAETADDAAAIAFVLEAQDGVTKRFVGVFLQPADVDAPTVTALEYSGIVRPEMTSEDLRWHGAKWSSSPEPIRLWDVTVKNFFEGVIDQYSLRDLIYGKQVGNPSHPDYVKGIDYGTFPWASAASRLAYSTTSWQVYWNVQASLNKFMRAIADNLADTLAAHGFGTFTVDLAESPLGVWMSPATFHSTGADTPLRDEASPYTIDFDKERELRLGDTTELYELFISRGDIMPDTVTSPPGVEGEAEENHSVLSCETFVDFIYRTALCLGMYVRFEYTTATELRISFSSRAGVVKHEIWIPDVEKASLDVGPADAEDKRSFRGFAFSMAAEGTKANQGSSWYHYDQARRLYLESVLTKNHRDAEGDDLLFTVAPVMRRFGRVDGMPSSWNAACLPHDVFGLHTPTGSVPIKETNVTAGVTNQLFMNAGTVGSPHILPVASLRVKIGGVGDIYYSLHEYVNTLAGRDDTYFKTEYELTVPYLCSIRKSADGLHADDDGGRGRWQNLDLGCKLTLDGVEYSVVGYERKYRSLETTLRLHRLSRFSFEQETAPQTAMILAPAEGAYAAGEGDETVVECGEDIAAGDAIAIRSSGKAFRAVALGSDYGRVLGIATSAAVLGDFVRVQFGGIAAHGSYAFTPGARVFLRTTSFGTTNVQSSRLTGMTATEDMFLELGTALTATSLRLDIGRPFIFAPGIAV